MLNLYKPRRQLIKEAVSALGAYGIREAVQERLVLILDEQDDRELYRANPRLLAAHLQLEERNALQILVMALKEGIMTLNWEVECPVCKGLDTSPNGLSDLQAMHTCPMCRHIHPTDADDHVRVTFSVDERLRKLGSTADDEAFRAKMDRRYGVVSAHQLMTLQIFRQLFPRETLPPNESMLIRRVAILFTDLAGSTALYSRRGDTRAFELVRQHFELLFRIIDEYNGSVTKTIGDAVMGTFTVPSDALKAAIAMRQQLGILNQQLSLPPDDHLILKIGIDAGPCISVNLNNRVDYFGTTVNTAARVQATSTGNCIAVTESVLKDATAAQLLNTLPWERRSLTLKGLMDPVTVYYLSMATP